MYTIYLSENDVESIKSMLPIIGKLIFDIDQTKLESDLLDSINLKKIPRQEQSIARKSSFKLTKKEISNLPEEFKKLITIELNIPVRQKPNGVYEARFRKGGYNISVSASNFDDLKPKFLQRLKNEQQTVATVPDFPKSSRPLFTKTAARWLELRRPLIKPTTYEYYLQLFGANIYPPFLDRYIDDIKQSDVQALLNKYIGQEKYRTALKIFQTLNAIFEFAVGEELIEHSPMRLLRPPKYEERKGVALTLEEEREFIRLLNGSKCDADIKSGLLFLLYTGIRRSELARAHVDGDFICVVSSKTRKGFQEKRRFIPITPMLAAWMHDFELEKMHTLRPDALTQAFKRLMPAHHLHELRHTFITRAQECGVPREVVSVWAGHAADNTQTSNVYTHFSPEHMKMQAQKVKYEL